MKKLKVWFTLVELIVVITILSILATIWFISMSGYARMSRDTTRLSDLTLIAKSIELSRLETGQFPSVTNGINITFSGSNIWTQWSFGIDSQRDAKRISEVPVDPLTFNEYPYAFTFATGEYQVGAMLEWWFAANNVNQAVAQGELFTFSSSQFKWNYNGKFITHLETINPSTKKVYVLWVPSLLANEVVDVTIEEIYTNESFVYDGWRGVFATYSWSTTPSTWSFTPTLTDTWEQAVIYEGTSNELSTGTGKIALVNNIHTYFWWTIVSQSESYQWFDVDTVTNPNQAIELVNTYITSWVWWLGNDEIEVTQVVAENSGWWINCLDMTPAQLSDLNNWVSIDPNSGTASAGTSSLTKEQWCNLDTVYANNASLTSIPSAIGMLVDLEFLDVRNNSITTVPDELVNLQKVVWLNFFKNQLPEIPDVVYEMDGIETLAINHNAILTVDPEIKNMDSLRVLYLTSMWTRASSWSVQVPPIEVSQIPTLRELYMANNDYTSVPDYLSNLTELTAFHIYNNNLSGLSPTMCSFIASRWWSSPSTWTAYTGNYRDAWQDTWITNLCPPAT